MLQVNVCDASGTIVLGLYDILSSVDDGLTNIVSVKVPVYMPSFHVDRVVHAAQQYLLVQFYNQEADEHSLLLVRTRDLAQTWLTAVFHFLNN